MREEIALDSRVRSGFGSSVERAGHEDWVQLSGTSTGKTHCMVTWLSNLEYLALAVATSCGLAVAESIYLSCISRILCGLNTSKVQVLKYYIYPM